MMLKVCDIVPISSGKLHLDPFRQSPESMMRRIVTTIDDSGAVM